MCSSSAMNHYRIFQRYVECTSIPRYNLVVYVESSGNAGTLASPVSLTVWISDLKQTLFF